MVEFQCHISFNGQEQIEGGGEHPLIYTLHSSGEAWPMSSFMLRVIIRWLNNVLVFRIYQDLDA